MSVMLSIRDVNRAIEKHIRDAAINLGYSVDPAAYVNDTPGYRSAIDALEIYVQVIGGGVMRDRGQIEKSTIVINQTELRRSNYSNPVQNHFHRDNGSGYDRIKTPLETYDIQYDIRTLASRYVEDAAIQEILHNSVMKRSYLSGLDSQGNILEGGFLLSPEGEAVLVNYEDIMERTCPSVARYVFLGKEVIDGTRSKITEQVFNTGTDDQTTELNI